MCFLSLSQWSNSWYSNMFSAVVSFLFPLYDSVAFVILEKPTHVDSHVWFSLLRPYLANRHAPSNESRTSWFRYCAFFVVTSFYIILRSSTSFLIAIALKSLYTFCLQTYLLRYLYSARTVFSAYCTNFCISSRFF